MALGFQFGGEGGIRIARAYNEGEIGYFLAWCKYRANNPLQRPHDFFGKMPRMGRDLIFVLGAGASHPYGFPLASQLSAEICSEAEALLEPWIAKDDFSPYDVNRFVSEFRMSALSSVDAFLERRTIHTTIGKLAIARKLCQLEDHDVLFDHDTKENWYKALWNQMAAGKDNATAALRNVGFVTFNYDRSLEAFIFSAVTNTFGVGESEAFRQLESVPIIHVYGSLGAFATVTALDKSRRPYMQVQDVRSIDCAARCIHIMPEGRNEDCAKSFKEARALFGEAKIICFLGFGYDSQNLERLNLPCVLNYKTNHHEPLPRLVLSVMGKTKMQTGQIVNALRGGTLGGFDTHDHTNLDTLRESGLV